MAFRVLIIDDDPSFIHVVEMRLREIHSDLEPIRCGSLKEARAFLEKTSNSVDLVILDQHLPDGEGLELLEDGYFSEIVVIAVSSDDSPEIPGATIQAGAAYFLNKVDIAQPLFKPLIEGILDRNRLYTELIKARIDKARMETVRTLVSTLKHEINNPLGAVMGATYLVKSGQNITDDQLEAIKVIESSGKRITHVLNQLAEAVELESVKKADEEVFHVPGDKPWKGAK
ncbi:MAG: response regulator [Candidatus Dadabacteria bacterium]|nr:MAG: response regulator [Candidatus Dadabacteria bacterium]